MQWHRELVWIVGYATIDEEFLGDTLQFSQRASDVAEAELLQKRAMELHLSVAILVDGREIDVIVKAGDVAIQKRGFAGSIGADNGDQAIRSFRRVDQVVHQQRILVGIKNLRRFR